MKVHTDRLRKHVILFAEVFTPDSVSVGSAVRPPQSAVKSSMAAVLVAIGQHNGRSFKRAESAVIACFDSAAEAARCAINMQKVFEEEQAETTYVLALRIAMDYGWGSLESGSVMTEADVIAGAARSFGKGAILVSENIRSSISSENIEFGAQSGRFITLVSRGSDYAPAEAARNLRFAYGIVLSRGEFPQCFYCGSKEHVPKSCPSKEITEMTKGLDRLGRLTIREINDAFRQYLVDRRLAQWTTPTNRAEADVKEPILAAHFGLFEVRQVFQFRFLNAMWDPPEYYGNSWEKIRRSDAMALSGGGLRLAADYLRAGQIDEAEEMLKGLEWSGSKDFRLFCLYGLVNVERNALSIATYFFAKASECARTTAQRIYTHLLRYRALTLDGKKRQAEEVLRIALGLDRSCPEVIFEDVLRQFELGRLAEALTRLLGLIAENNEYWAAAIICPDLALYHDLVMPELEKLFERTKTEGRKFIAEAETRLGNLKQVITGEDQELLDLEASREDLASLALKDTYLDWWDVVMKASRLVSACKRTEQERRNRVLAAISDVEERLYDALRNPYASRKEMQASTRRVAEGIMGARSGLLALEPHSQVLAACSLLSQQIDGIKARLVSLERRQKIVAKVRAFLRDFLVFLAVAGPGTAIAPLLLLYLESRSYLPESLQETGVVWVYHTLAVVALVSSVCFALIRGVLRDQRDTR